MAALRPVLGHHPHQRERQARQHRSGHDVGPPASETAARAIRQVPDERIRKGIPETRNREHQAQHRRIHLQRHLVDRDGQVLDAHAAGGRSQAARAERQAFPPRYPRTRHRRRSGRRGGWACGRSDQSGKTRSPLRPQTVQVRRAAPPSQNNLPRPHRGMSYLLSRMPMSAQKRRSGLNKPAAGANQLSGCRRGALTPRGYGSRGVRAPTLVTTRSLAGARPAGGNRAHR